MKPSWRSNRLWLWLALALLWAAQAALPQNGTTNKPESVTASTPEKPKASASAEGKPDEQATKTNDRVRIEHADTLRYNGETKVYQLRGKVILSNQDMKLYCDAADYNEQADTAKANGNLKVVSEDAVVTGDLIDADFGKKLIIITGHVRVLAQRKRSNKATASADQAAVSHDKGPGKSAPPAKDGSNKPSSNGETNVATKGGAQSDEPRTMNDYAEKQTTITCDKLEYYYDDAVKKMVATPRVKAVQEDKTVWADQAVYEENSKLITLTGDVFVQTEKGDEMRCAKAVISTEDDWLQAENMSGITTRRNKETTTKPASGQPSGAPGGAKPNSGLTPTAPPTGGPH